MSRAERPRRVQASLSWAVVARIVGLALLPLLLWFSRDFGVTWDEGYRQANGERIWRLYQGHEVPAAPANEELHGGLFDVMAVGLQQVIPLDRYDVRHLLNATFGWVGVILCGWLTARVGGPSAAISGAARYARTARRLASAFRIGEAVA